VTAPRSRDQLLENTLKHGLSSAAAWSPASECLDAETLAAWADGGLDRQQAALTEVHLSNCGHCQALLAALTQALPPSVSRDRDGTRALWRWWPVPATAAAAAVVLWVVIPQEQYLAPPEPSAEIAQSPGAASAGAGAAPPAALLTPETPRPETPAVVERPPTIEVRADAPAPAVTAATIPATSKPASTPPTQAPPAAVVAPPQVAVVSPPQVAVVSPPQVAVVAPPRVAENKAATAVAERAASTDARRETVAPKPTATPTRTARAVEAAPAPTAVPTAASPPAAAAPPAAPAPLRAAGPGQVLSPDPLVRWRFSADGLEYSINGGGIWDQVSGAIGPFVTAGSAPSATVCWLVARGGGVFVTGDGRNFFRARFPEITNLVGVTATSRTAAIVTAEDGRTFATADGGVTWRQQ